MKLVVGLGNPGRQYQETRHNAGFLAIDSLARRLGWTTGASEFDRLARQKFEGLAMDGAGVGGEKVLLLKPMTYMNLSGRSVQAARAFYQVEPVDLLVIVDDMALPLGRIRLRADGSSGGHNGLKDIERALGGNRYPRLRIGIGAAGPGQARDYVLSGFNAEQRKALDAAIEKSVDATMLWMEKGVEAAMTRFNAEES